jgi:hypothetical protein
LAASVRGRLEATKHHVVATLRCDGSPRVSGTEVQFHGPDLVAGGMPGALKGRDLRRDPRYALHSNPGDGSMDGGDAKVSGTAVEVVDPAALLDYANAIERPQEPGAPLDFELFRFLITDVVRTSVHPDGDRLLIESWRPGVGLRTVERR